MNLMKFQIIDFLKEVLKEDIGRGDLARDLIPNKIINARVLAKSEGVIAGIEYIKYFTYLADVKFDFNFDDGDFYKKGDIIFTLNGNAKDILSIERSLLNILQHASGIASNAYEFAKRVYILILYFRLIKHSIRKEGVKNFKFNDEHRLNIFNLVLKSYSIEDVFKNIERYIKFNVNFNKEEIKKYFKNDKDGENKDNEQLSNIKLNFLVWDKNEILEFIRDLK